MNAAIRQAAAMVGSRIPEMPTIGIVLGSGQGAVAHSMHVECAWSYADLPGLPVPTAGGHAGCLQFGEWMGRSCVVAQGRCHLYEGHSWDTAALIALLMMELRVSRIILTNAAGGLNPRFRAGQIMVIRDHINFMFRHSMDGSDRAGTFRPVYDRAWADRVVTRASQGGVAIQQGVYVGVLGPNYETRAEYRMLRRIGADAVGMSTIPEATAAAACQVPVLGLSVITNEARPDAPHVVSHDEVIDWATRAESDLRKVLEAAIVDCPSD